jgi:uncharacterized protein (TIGR02118 family)
VSVSYFVRYDIEVPDVAAFLRRYREVHVPMVAGWPGLRAVTLHTPLEWRDAAPVNKGKAVLLAQLEFETQADLDRACASRERAEAREDFKRFMRFEGTVTHQAMATEEVWRRRRG